MRKRILSSIIVIAMLAALVGCTSKPAQTTAATSNNNESTSTAEGDTDMIIVADMLEVVNWPGKKLSELGITVEERRTSSKIQGPLFGANAEGNIGFSFDAVDKTVEDIFLYSYDISVVGLYDNFKELYSGPTNWGMEPYVAVNNGALQWFVFDAGEAVVKISQGSQASFAEIQISVNPNPSKLVGLKLKESDPNKYKEDVEMKVIGYDNGVLKVEITNNTDSEITVEGEFSLWQQAEGGNGFYSMNKISFGIPMSQNESEVLAAGESVEKEFDIRDYGKVEAKKYKLKYGEIDCTFELAEE